MTGAERLELRRLIDASVRARLRAERREALGRCQHCRCSWLAVTPGCPACDEYRALRPERLEELREIWRARGCCSGCGCPLDLRTAGCNRCDWRYEGRARRQSLRARGLDGQGRPLRVRGARAESPSEANRAAPAGTTRPEIPYQQRAAPSEPPAIPAAAPAWVETALAALARQAEEQLPSSPGSPRPSL
jgi:hypothetical protein